VLLAMAELELELASIQMNEDDGKKPYGLF
jgi:hypothetical protein